MRKYTLLQYLIISFCCISFFSQAQNINLSNSPYWDGECYLAVNPQNPKHLVSAWMYFSLSNLKNAIATRSSFDGGKTWSTLQILPHVYSSFPCADPSIYFGKDSSVYLAYIDLSGLHSSDSGYDMVARSVNGGITWKIPVKAIAWNAQPNLPIDRPWVVADAGNDGTWAPIKQMDDSIPASVITDATAFATIASNGTLYAVYFSYYVAYSPYARLIMVKSYNGGATFTTHAAINYTAADVIPAADSLLKDGICISSNPADTSNLIIVGPSNHFGEPDIVSFNSHDAGTTWSSPVRVNDDLAGAHDTAHDLTWGSFAPDGVYAVIWRDRRHTNTGDTVPFQIYGATSVNGVNNYTPNFLISDTISPFIDIERGDDFLGCAVTDSGIYALWSDMRTGKENTFFNATQFSKIPMGVVSVSDNSTIKVDAYPNPFHNETNIVVHSLTPLQNGILQVFSMDGRLQEELPIPANGIYNLHVNFPGGTYIWSVIQNNNAIAHGKWVIE